MIAAASNIVIALSVFVFRNRRATAVKVLAYDGQGFWLCHK
jgi:transposase